MTEKLLFGTVVKVKPDGRHDTDLMPYAVTLTEGINVWQTDYARYYAVFIDNLEDPIIYAFAKLYSNEIDSIVYRLSPIQMAELTSDADDYKGR